MGNYSKISKRTSSEACPLWGNHLALDTVLIRHLPSTFYAFYKNRPSSFQQLQTEMSVQDGNYSLTSFPRCFFRLQSVQSPNLSLTTRPIMQDIHSYIKLQDLHLDGSPSEEEYPSSHFVKKQKERINQNQHKEPALWQVKH